MATCKSCGTDIGESKFCPACGTSQGDDVGQPIQPISASPTPAYMPMQSASSMGDTQGQTTTQAPYSAPYTAPPYYPQQGSEGMPNRSGQMVFSIINIVLGAVFCCCTIIAFFTMVLGIIATVLCTQVDKSGSVEEAKRKLKTVMILNIVAVGLLVLGFVGLIILSVVVPDYNANTMEYYNSLSN